MEKKRTGQVLSAVNFMILMAALGASDSLRGIFAPAFQSHFSLNAMQLSVIIMVSYVGNLVFLCLGGRALDKYNRKKAAMGILLLWIGALLLYLLTDSYVALLVGMFFAMGTSTLLNTTVNILTPMIFATSPGMMVNIFFFVQGIGTSGSQNLAGRTAGSYEAFKLVNVILVVMGVISLILFSRMEFSQDGTLDGASEDTSENASAAGGQVPYREVFRQKGFLILVLIFGFYFIAEHGIMNWLVSYGTGALKLPAAKAAMYLSGFYGGITVGRLIFSPVVSKAGAFKSIRWFGGIGTALFVLGILLGSQGLALLSLSGLAVSIIYPTMVYMVHYIYPPRMLGAGLGAVISVATLFDIGFNVVFGRMVDVAGYGVSFLVIPLSMVLFYGCYLIFSKICKEREDESRND